MNTIEIKDINLGGLADSAYQGLKHSIAAGAGLQLHQEPGIIKINQKLVNDSGVVIDEFVKSSVACSDGSTYFFSATSGKIWQRTSLGVYSLAAVNANGACLGAGEFDGFIFYATATKLGKWTIGTAWSTRDDSFGTFTVGDTGHKPFFKKNGLMYIGDGYLVAQINEDDSFTANALDLPKEFKITCFGESYTNVLIGTIISSNTGSCRIFKWDGTSESWATDDEVFEIGLNSFVKMDNLTVLQAGKKGNLYYYNGIQLDQYKQIPGSWDGSLRGLVYDNAGANYNSMPLFGVSNEIGNPVTQGIYSFGNKNRNYPKILNLEYLISVGGGLNTEIGSITPIEDNLLITWKNSSVVTMTIADPCVVTWANHGQVNGNRLILSTTGALPTGLISASNYYARVVDANTLHLYNSAAEAIAGGATGRVTTTGTQSGVHTASNYGVDKIDYSNKYASAYLETRLINIDRGNQKDFTVDINYRLLPTSTNVVIKYKVNHESTWKTMTTTIDTDRHLISADAAIPGANVIQFRFEFTVSVNTAPEVESITITFP